MMTTRQQHHEALAMVWARYNGQKGTAKQLVPIMRQLSISDLERMLSERGYIITWTAEQ